MPRFQFSSYNDAPLIPTSRQQRGLSSSSSCRLVSLSPDGRSVHTLVKGRYIETRRLPLEESENYESTNTDIPVMICTELPSEIVGALEIDPPVELLCVEGESQRQQHDKEQQLLPRLCLYTRKSAFLFQISYSSNEARDDTVEGQIDWVDEPFERLLEVSMATSIVRIRPAPQSSAGYATISPAACLAVLLENSDTIDYSLLLRHGDGTVTSPLHCRVEDVTEAERFTDFCFAQSIGLSIFPSLSVLLLKGSGDVFAASPVVFDGTVIAKAMVDDGHNYLQGQLDQQSDRTTARWRQCKAAAQFLIDIFDHQDNRSHFCTARILNQNENSAAMWPIKLQGPLLFHSEVEPGPLSIAIESFGSSDCFAGLAIGKLAGKVDFAAVSSTSLIPRFAFECPNDSLELDDALYKLGSLVERVDLSPNGSMKESSICIVKDPIMETLLHYATPTCVCTVSTNAMRMASRKIKGQPVDPVRTTAWICLSSADALLGIVVPSDAAQGHVLVAGLDDASMIPINITESKYLHEFESLFQSLPADQLLLEGGAGDKASVPLYAEEVKPLLKKINAGLSNMGRIVGSQTNYQAITPDSLAVAIQIKKRCDNEIVLPLLELMKTVKKHRVGLKSVLEQQREQLQSAIESIKDLKIRISAIGEQVEATKTNASALSKRSLTAVHSCNRLLPKLTQAEFDYFQALKRLRLKCSKMEAEVRKLNELVLPKCNALAETTDSAAVSDMDEDSIKRANALLRYQSDELKKIRDRLTKSEELTKRLVREHGIAT